MQKTEHLELNLPDGDDYYNVEDFNENAEKIDEVIYEMKQTFQAGVDACYDACETKGSTPASHALSDVVQGILDIETGGGLTPGILYGLGCRFSGTSSDYSNINLREYTGRDYLVVLTYGNFEYEAVSEGSEPSGCPYDKDTFIRLKTVSGAKIKYTSDTMGGYREYEKKMPQDEYYTYKGYVLSRSIFYLVRKGLNQNQSATFSSAVTGEIVTDGSSPGGESSICVIPMKSFCNIGEVTFSDFIRLTNTGNYTFTINFNSDFCVLIIVSPQIDYYGSPNGFSGYPFSYISSTDSECTLLTSYPDYFADPSSAPMTSTTYNGCQVFMIKNNGNSSATLHFRHPLTDNTDFDMEEIILNYCYFPVTTSDIDPDPDLQSLFLGEFANRYLGNDFDFSNYETVGSYNNYSWNTNRQTILSNSKYITTLLSKKRVCNYKRFGGGLTISEGALLRNTIWYSSYDNDTLGESVFIPIHNTKQDASTLNIEFEVTNGRTDTYIGFGAYAITNNQLELIDLVTSDIQDSTQTLSISLTKPVDVFEIQTFFGRYQIYRIWYE